MGATRARHAARAALASAALAAALPSCSGSSSAAPAPSEPSYLWLSETGLYSDLAAQVVAADVRPFEPAYPLWSDGADKARWIALPDGAPIDTADMNHWQLPVGTRLYKEFALGGVRLETRLIERWGPGPADYWMGAFVWLEDGSDAELSEAGAVDVLGTPHDVPARDRCTACHNGEPGRALGFSALQLASSPLELDLARLAAEGRLSAPPGAEVSLAVTGEPDAAAALGYLHANCGNCHNPRGAAWPDTQMLLRLGLEGASVNSAPVIDNLLGVPLQYYRDQSGAISVRVVPGHAEQSGLIARMSVRGPKEQMPPLATEQVDEQGVALVRRWIDGLLQAPP